eukprot:5789435-Prymnesium_polylepis.1
MEGERTHGHWGSARTGGMVSRSNTSTDRGRLYAAHQRRTINDPRTKKESLKYYYPNFSSPSYELRNLA